MSEEVWKDVPGYEYMYQVSNLGRVRSLQRLCKVNGINRKGHFHDEMWLRKGRVLKPILASDWGSLVVHLHDKDGVRKNCAIKCLVASAFLLKGSKTIPPAWKVKTIDGNKFNCSVDNIKLTK